eukprot:jgi/Mesvir1/14177/Mv09637-RA.1
MRLTKTCSKHTNLRSTTKASCITSNTPRDIFMSLLFVPRPLRIMIVSTNSDGGTTTCYHRIVLFGIPDLDETTLVCHTSLSRRHSNAPQKFHQQHRQAAIPHSIAAARPCGAPKYHQHYVAPDPPRIEERAHKGPP